MVFEQYLQISTFHGLSDLHAKRPLVLKVLWIGILGAIFSFCAKEVIETVLMYRKHELTTLIEEMELDEIPTFTACESRYDDDPDLMPIDTEHDPRNVCTGFDRAKFIQGLYKAYRWWLFYRPPEDLTGCPKDPKDASTAFQLSPNGSYDSDIARYPACYRSINSSNLIDTVVSTLPRDPDPDRWKRFNFVFKDSQPGSKETPKYSVRVSEETSMIFDGSVRKRLGFQRCFGFQTLTNLTADSLQGMLKFKTESSHVLAMVDHHVVFQGRLKRGYLVQIQLALHLRSRLVRCSKENLSFREKRHREVVCFNEHLMAKAGCCICGVLNLTCGPRMRCCLERHICAFAQRHPDVFDRCKSEYLVPCRELKVDMYGTVTKGKRSSERSIQVRFPHEWIVLHFHQVEVMTVSDALSRIGGFLGIFVGGSIISFLQLVLFCGSHVWNRWHPPDKKESLERSDEAEVRRLKNDEV